MFFSVANFRGGGNNLDYLYDVFVFVFVSVFVFVKGFRGDHPG